MDIASLGIPTHHTRVERWQCDFNDHWNARFYGRSFQCAAETIATLDGSPNPGAAIIAQRHIRYHRELRVGAAVEVRSARLRGGPLDGSILHLLLSGRTLSAIAVDRPGIAAHHLPDIPADLLARLLPRDLHSPQGVLPDGGDAFRGEVGPVRSGEIDHTGNLLFEEIIARTAITSHSLLLGLGFTMEFTEQSGIGRMAIELSVARHGDVAAGTVLVTRGRLSDVSDKSFSLDHWLGTREGRQVAAVRHTLLAVDLRTRRATAVPGFLRAS